MDRASGSGVFARDPDALIDLVELEVTEELYTQRINHTACRIYKEALQEKNNTYYKQYVSLDDLYNASSMRAHFEKGIQDVLDRAPYVDKINDTRRAIEISTAWRVEGTLREFAKFKPVNMWFSYPVHFLDDSGVLADIQLDGEKPMWQKGQEGRKSKEQNQKERNEKLETAYSALFDGSSPVTVNELKEYLGLKSTKSVENYIREHDGFDIKKGIVFPIKEKEK